MKQKVSDYIADRLAQEGISQVFTVTGGGAMHLNDSLGHHPGLSCLYHHHEQAAAMAAEAYARVDNRMRRMPLRGPCVRGWIPSRCLSCPDRCDTIPRCVTAA